MPAFQYWFTGMALAAFIGVLTSISTFLAVGYGWYRAALSEMETAINKVASSANKKRTETTKRLLGLALANGGRLVANMADKTGDQFEQDANAWGQSTHNMIGAAYGDGEAALFLDSSGYVFHGDSSKKARFAFGLMVVCGELQNFFAAPIRWKSEASSILPSSNREQLATSF